MHFWMCMWSNPAACHLFLIRIYNIQNKENEQQFF